jgi:hypothetical protein
MQAYIALTNLVDDVLVNPLILVICAIWGSEMADNRDPPPAEGSLLECYSLKLVE